MGDGMVTPWNVLADAIEKKVGEARAKSEKAKQDEFTVESKSYLDIIGNPNSSDEQREWAKGMLKKISPKDSHPLVDAAHKAFAAMHKFKKSKQGGQGQGQGQPSPGQGKGGGPSPTSAAQSPSAGGPPAPGNAPSAAPSPAAAPLPPGVPPTMSVKGISADLASQGATQEGELAGQKQVAQQVVVEKHNRQTAEQTIKALEDKGYKIPDEVKESIMVQAAGFNVPASVLQPKTAPPKAPKLTYGPGGQFRGVEVPEDKETNTPGATYPSRAMIPTDRKDLLDLWDAGSAEQKKEEKAELDKESRKNAQMVQMLGDRLEQAIKLGDQKAAKKLVNDADKQYQDAINRARTMDDNLRDIKTAKVGGKENQQAMLSLLANHVGMTSGSQPKMRMSKAQWDEAKDSVPLIQRVEAKFDSDGYLSGVVLTDDQMEQMVGLAHEKLDILKQSVEDIKTRHADELNVSPSLAVPPNMKKPGKGNGKGASTTIVVTTEDMAHANANR